MIDNAKYANFILTKKYDIIYRKCLILGSQTFFTHFFTILISKSRKHRT